MLAEVLQDDGFRAVSLVTTINEGAPKAIDFLRQTQPQACVFAVSLPYRESWEEFQQLQQAVPDCTYVLTTTNKRALDEIVGPTCAIEIIGKPYDIAQVTGAVRRALDGR